MTAEVINFESPDNQHEADIIPLRPPQEALTADEIEFAMHVGRLTSIAGANMEKAMAEHALYEAKLAGAPPDVISQLEHTVRMARTEQIIARSLPPEAHRSLQYYLAED